MPSSFISHPSSYRDPSGFLFYKNDVLYRQVNQSFKKDFDQFINGGLYEHLVEKKILVSHETIIENLTASANWYQTLKPQMVPFISYPYEWCFDMLKDAALITLEAAGEAMNFGMMLKDASAYNVQLNEGRMMFIDTLSFEKYDEQKPWIAYRQFCEHFFAPLALMHYLKEPLQNLILAHFDGVPLSLAKKLLPFRSKLNLHTYLHLHLQSSLSKKKQATSNSAGNFSKQKMKNLFQSLEQAVRSFSFSERSGVWSDYYEEANQRQDYVKTKKEIITEWLEQLQPNTVLDIGTNEGEFSLLAATKSKYVISSDLDHYSINRLYHHLKQKQTGNIHPLIIDFTNPTPAIGVNNEERNSFLSRAKSDLVMVLAFIHHIAIGKNVPFEKMAAMLSSLGDHIIIEFVPKDDPKVQIMLSGKKDIYTDYNEQTFENAFGNLFSVIKKQAIANSGRTLYLLKKNG